MEDWMTVEEGAAYVKVPKRTFLDWIRKGTIKAYIRTTMNIYGSVVTDEMKTAHSKVVRMALSGEQKNWEIPKTDFRMISLSATG